MSDIQTATLVALITFRRANDKETSIEDLEKFDERLHDDWDLLNRFLQVPGFATYLADALTCKEYPKELLAWMSKDFD